MTQSAVGEKTHFLFDQAVEQGVWDPKKPYEYEHGLVMGDVLSELQDALYLSDTPTSSLVRIVDAARVVTSLVDYKVANPDSAEAPNLVYDAQQLALSVYSQSSDTLAQIVKLRRTIVGIDESIFEAPVKHRIGDTRSWEASSPQHSETSAQRLISRLQGRPLLFIPLARGGVAAGTDVFLRYTTQTEDDQSVIYPVRFSMHKSKDTVPRVNEAEAEFLQKMAKGRHLVVFDEDSIPYRGNTLSKAAGFMMELLGEKQPRTLMANYYS